MKTIKINKLTIPYICTFLLLVNFFISNSNLDINLNVIRISVVVLLIFNFVMPPAIIKKKDLVIICVLLIYYIFFNQSMGLNIFVLYMLAFFLSRDNIEIVKEKFMKYLLFICFVWLILIITNILPDKISFDYGRIRHYLGFKNINQTAVLYTPLLILLYDKYSKRGITIKFAIILIGVFLYYLTNTRTAFLVFIIYILFNSSHIIQHTYKNNYKKYLNFMIEIFLIIITIAFVFSANVIESFPILNEITTNRLSIIANGMSNMNTLNYFFGINELLLDNSYIILISSFGLIGFGYFLYKINYTLNYAENKEWNLIIVTLIYGFFESIIFIPESIIAIMFFTILIKINSRSIINENQTEICKK